MSRRAARQRLFPHRLCAGLRADRDAPGARQACRSSCLRLLLSADRLGVSSRSRLPGVSRLHRLAIADAADRLCRPDLARPCGAACAGAFTAGILFKEFNTPFWVTVPAAARGRRGARRHVRPAVASAARAISRGLDARAAFHGGLCSAANMKPSAASPPAS